MPEPLSSSAVTLAFSRRVRPGAEAAFEAWLREIAHVSSQQAGHLGATVIRSPAQGARGQLFTVVFRFASEAAWLAWANAPERLALIERAEAISEVAQDVQRAEGLDYWFAPPDAAGEPRPRKWKLALVLAVCVYAVLQAIVPLYALIVPAWPVALVRFIEVATTACLMTWLVMPAATRLLSGWLFSDPARET